MARIDGCAGMSDVAALPTGRTAEVLRRIGNWCAANPLLLCALILLIAPFWQMRWGTVGDTAWLIHVCEQILSGQRLYIDVVETNPPASVMLYMPPVWLASRLGVDADVLTAAYSYAVVLFGLGFAAWIVRRGSLADWAALRVASPLVLALFVLMPGNAFSEREHLGTAMLLPLLALAAWRAKPDAQTLRPWTAAGAGLCGSLIVILKPHYVVVVIACAAFVAWRRRDWRRIFDIEYWAAGTLSLAYAATVVLAFPEFLSDIYPDLRDVYLPIRSYLPILVNFAGGYVLAMALCWRLLRGTHSDLAPLLVTASLAGLLPVIIQAKAWPYHVYPAVTIVLLALICLVAMRRPATRLPSWKLVAVAVVACWAPFFPTQKPPSDLLAQIEREAPRPSVALIGSDLAFGLPLARLAGGTWVSRNNADWKGAGALYMRSLAKAQGRDAEARQLDDLLTVHVTEKLAELERARPDLLVLQTEEGFWIDHMKAQPRFAALLAEYELMRAEKRYWIYRRVRPAPSPVAASG